MKTIKIAAMLMLVLMIAGCNRKYEQPELGARKVHILTEGEYQFKDLNTSVVAVYYTKLLYSVSGSAISPTGTHLQIGIIKTVFQNVQTSLAV